MQAAETKRHSLWHFVSILSIIFSLVSLLFIIYFASSYQV